jgi:ribosomal small subunit protein bTHX
MGKGDKRSRRGKIFAGTFGKTRRKNKKAVYKPTEAKPVKKRASKKETAGV